MKKQIKKFLSIIVVLTLTAVIALSAVACDLNSSNAGSGNSGSGSSGEIVNPDPKPEPTPTPDPDPKPSEPSEPTPAPDPEPSTPTAVKPENFTVNFDNNTTTITVDASWDEQKGSAYTVKVEYNGTEQTYTANDASISLSLAQAPINEYDVSVSVKSNGNKDKYLESEYTESETISKLTPSEYYALTTSYGIDNRYCSTKGELALQYAYIGEFETVDNELGYLHGGKKATYDGECFVYYALPDRDELLNGLTTDSDKITALHEKVGMTAAFEGSANTATSCYLVDGRSGDEAYWMVIKPNPAQKNRIATTKINPTDYADGENAVAVNLNGQPLNVSATGRKNDKLPIDDNKQTMKGISLSPALYTAVINGYKVEPKAGTRAEEIWNYSRKVLKAITDENMSEKEIALAIYDWVMFRTNYNSPSLVDNSENYNQFIDGVLGGTDYNLGVCAAYAKSYAVLCNMMGLDCVYVSGTVGGYAHAWNKVKIDGVWYCVDTTHGDSTMTLSGTTYELGSHEYFMLSDKQLSDITYNGRVERGGYYDMPEATTDYNYFEHVTFVAEDGKTYNLKINASDEAQINAVVEYFYAKYQTYQKTGGVVITDPVDTSKTVIGKIAMFEFDADDATATATITALYRKLNGNFLGMSGCQAYFQIASIA